MQGKSLTYSRSLAALILTLLIGCDAVPAQCPVPVIRADRCVKDWLRSVKIPDCGMDYLDRIGKQQKALEEIKG